MYMALQPEMLYAKTSIIKQEFLSGITLYGCPSVTVVLLFRWCMQSGRKAKSNRKSI